MEILEKVNNKIASRVSFFGVILYYISFNAKQLGLSRSYKDFCCADDITLNLFLIFIPLFVLSLVSFKLRKDVFDVWKKITVVYLVLFFVLYFLSPTQGNGYIWFQREMVSFFGTIVFSLISIGFILYKSLKKE